MLAAQGGKCTMCAEILTTFDADHHCPYRDSFKGQAQVLRALCSICHRSITDSSARRAENPLLSHFSPATHEGFVRSPPPVQFVLPASALETGPIVNIDVRRCRRSCLVESTEPEPWSVFCAHDEFVELGAQPDNGSKFTRGLPSKLLDSPMPI